MTVDGTTYLLEAPFLVIATQNPIEMEGTYPLPEAQRDRFTARISIGYPTAAAELEMLDTHGSSSPLDSLKPVATAVDVRQLIGAVRGVLVTGQVKEYIIALAAATRSAPELRLGASPRAALQLLRASRARAALDGRDYVIPDDIQALISPGVRAPAAADRRGAGRAAPARAGGRPDRRADPAAAALTGGWPRHAQAAWSADGTRPVVRRGRRGGGNLRAAHPRTRPAADRGAADGAAAAVRVRVGPGQVPAVLRSPDDPVPAARRADRRADHPADQRLAAAHRAAAGRGHRARTRSGPGPGSCSRGSAAAGRGNSRTSSGRTSGASTRSGRCGSGSPTRSAWCRSPGRSPRPRR